MSQENMELQEKSHPIDQSEWLKPNLFEKFLKEAFPNFTKITKFLIEPAVPIGENFITTLLRIIIEVEMSNGYTDSISYIIKTKPKSEQFCTITEDWQVFKKENLLYTKYLPQFEKYFLNVGEVIQFAPQILISKNLNITEDFILLEDLRRKGFSNGKRHIGLDMDHTKAVLRKLAKFHAASAKYVEDIEQFPNLFQQCVVTDKDYLKHFRMNAGKALQDNLHLYGDFKELREKLKIYIPQQPDYYQTNFKHQPGEFQVLNHSDLWINNIMFQYHDDGSIKETYFIDYQMCRYGSPAQDLYYFLLSSIHIEIKIKYFDYFIAFYHRDLDENLKLLSYKGNIPTLKDLHVALLNHDYCGYSAVINPLPVALTQPQDDVNMDNMMSADDSHDVRKDMFRSESYVDHMRIILPWMVYRGIFDSQFV